MGGLRRKDVNFQDILRVLRKKLNHGQPAVFDAK